MSDLDFDASSYERSDDPFDPIPEGNYTAVIEDTEKKETSDPTNDNAYLKLTLAITGPTMAGRKLFDNLNIWNSNPTASKIAKDSLYDICQAIGLSKVKDHEELRFKELGIKVSIEQDKTGKYDAQNRVKKYFHKSKVTGATSAAPGTAPAKKTAWS